MGFLKRIAGVFGFAKDEPHESNEEEDDTHVDHPLPQPHHNHHHHHHQQQHQQHHRGEEPRRATKGFSVKVPVAVDRANLGPIITPCNHGDGGVQGMKWYARRLRIDEDGDVADEFLNEVFPEVVEMSCGSDDRRRPLPKFEVSTGSSKVRGQMVFIDGKLRHGVEYQGKLQWV